ncbi:MULTISPECIES: cache domain-containing protein [unclassified Pseudoalteromonas]|uniref:cache domain-containing protein n=1 Tax=unclassified Pseudoalteromonas TaxID=194690 RepID=UPI000FDECC62|nr:MULTISPECIES: cache domain-containing protein [unclassified Pseudoalteromonas]
MMITIVFTVVHGGKRSNKHMKRVFQKFNYTLPLNLYKAINVLVFHKNEFIGVGGADILVTTISNMVEELKFQNQGQAFLFDSLGRTIHFSKLNNFRLNQPIAEKVATAVNNIISHLQLIISQIICYTNELDKLLVMSLIYLKCQ